MGRNVALAGTVGTRETTSKTETVGGLGSCTLGELAQGSDVGR